MNVRSFLFRFACTACLLPGLVEAAPAIRPNAQPPVPMGTRDADVVIALDTSGSMEPLLDAARARVWDVVNELAGMRPTPSLRVGLITYGSEVAREDDGWIAVQADLTDDLDQVYGVLMSLTTGGGDEFVGQAIDVAREEMTWSRDLDALRIVFVAGNEAADQGTTDFDFRESVRRATEADIIINALYAGNREQGIVERWPEIAQAGRGSFSAIDPELSTIQIATPLDEPLLELNEKLNGTYLPYGENGETGLANQLAQDGNATRLGVQSCSSRIVAKGTALYTNASWDLVDATLKEDFEWSALREAELPPELRDLGRDEQIAYVARMRDTREAIQLEIQTANEERERYIRAARKELDVGGLDDAMREAIRRQAVTKGFTCDEC